MARINIYDDEQDERQLAGWFDPDKCEEFESAERWDGSGRISVTTGARYDFDRLYRTPGGRWVLHRWSRWQGRPETHRFLTDDEARDWLLRSEINDGAVERYFGERADESGPAPTGRPSMGDAPPITVKVPAELLARIDAAAGRARIARAEWIRRACEAALS